MPQAVIHAKKILVAGKPKFEITGFDHVLTRDQVPSQYINSYSGTYFILSSAGTIICSHGPDIVIGKKFDPEDFSNRIKFLKDCGTRLTKIRQAEAKLKPKWNGQEVTVKI